MVRGASVAVLALAIVALVTGRPAWFRPFVATLLIAFGIVALFAVVLAFTG